MKKSFIVISVLLASVALKAQDSTLFIKKSFVEKTDTLPYRILLPVNYDSSKQYPLIVFLHGAGERGNDN